MCNRGIDAVLKMLFQDNFVHGDLHPGNILVTPDGQLAFIDAGAPSRPDPSAPTLARDPAVRMRALVDRPRLCRCRHRRRLLGARPPAARRRATSP
jgi:tRNA A-37 threonylcarbamoyl transferase component Bud32